MAARAWSISPAIHGVEEHAGATYLILECVEGQTLADLLERGPMPPADAVLLAAQIAQGLEAAHEAGVIHRDLKPANIIVTPEGLAKVLDFGLARSDDGEASADAMHTASLTSLAAYAPTMPGVVLGTAAYLSHEQARGRRVDKRTDIWSFGVVLYEMLVGVSPFLGRDCQRSDRRDPAQKHRPRHAPPRCACPAAPFDRALPEPQQVRPLPRYRRCPLRPHACARRSARGHTGSITNHGRVDDRGCRDAHRHRPRDVGRVYSGACFNQDNRRQRRAARGRYRATG